MDDLSPQIGVGHPSGKCPLCGSDNQDWQTCEPVKSHGLQMLAHVQCVDGARADEEKDEE